MNNEGMTREQALELFGLLAAQVERIDEAFDAQFALVGDVDGKDDVMSALVDGFAHRHQAQVDALREIARALVGGTGNDALAARLFINAAGGGEL